MSVRASVCEKQKEILVEFMERLPALALSTQKNRYSYIKARLIWDAIAKHLNKVDSNVKKSGKHWNRYFSDMKFKVRRKYILIKSCQKGELTPVEARLVKILTDNEGNLIGDNTMSVKERHKDTGGTIDTVPSGSKQLPSAKENSRIDDEESIEHLLMYEENENHEEYIMPTEHININETYPQDGSSQNIKLEYKDIEAVKKELYEFQIQKQKELFELEKKHKQERHKLEIEILCLRKELMKRQVNMLQRPFRGKR